MNQAIAIELTGVAKTFRRRTIPGGHTTFKSQFVGLFRGQRQRFPRRELHVLSGIDLRVPAGATLGIVGQNGSGKSTLLKLLAGIYRPTTGRVQIQGRLSALIELGAGFHPEFSGRENIYINGIILGRTRKEMDALAGSIIDFAELSEFIDEPVRTYSSGMYMRLAFSIATLVDPDILVIDEILAVGDEHFGRKSRERIESFKRQGKTLVLVTHDAAMVQSWCDIAVWLDHGTIAAKGNPVEVVSAYRRAIAERERAGTATVGPLPEPEAPAPLQPQAPAIELSGKDGPRSSFAPGEPFHATVALGPDEPPAGASLLAEILQGGRRLWLSEPLAAPGQRPGLELARLTLPEGEYELAASLVDAAGGELRRGRAAFTVVAKSAAAAERSVELEHRWSMDRAPSREAHARDELSAGA
ncbi:MAG: ABC transporter ATP-binding protein [Deltaproteobacteria bacterium]